jgi:hypothetical protein
MTKLLLSLILCAGALLADVTGKWSGSFDVTGPDGETKPDHAYMVLKQSGKTISGTAGPAEDHQFPIKTGTIDENSITMELETDGPVLKFELTVDGDHIRGTAKGEHEGKTLVAKLDLKRVD